MLSLYFVIALSSLLLHCAVADGNECAPLPIDHFQWLNADGSLVIPQPSSDVGIIGHNKENYDCCGPTCDEWRPLPETSSCQYCASNIALLCQGSDVYQVPSSVTLQSTKLSLFKMSGVGLISLPPKSFAGLSIKKLVIENSNLSYLALDTFSGVKSIEILYLKNNKLDYLPQAELLFKNINSLKFLSLENNGLKVLSSVGAANMHNLTYFSLAGNPLYNIDVFFLLSSALTFLDLRNVTFKLRNADIRGTGLNKLPNSLNTLDLSRATIPSKTLEIVMEQLKGKNITTLNLSYLQSQFKTFWALRHIQNSLQLLSLKGTDLYLMFSSKTTKHYNVIKSVQFVNIRELNLQDCNISSFGSGEVFKAFPNLTILSVAGNPIYILDLTFFSYLPKLFFMDFSNSAVLGVDPILNTNLKAQSLQAIDLSNSIIGLDDEESAIFFSTLPNLQMMSFCKSRMGSELAGSLGNLTFLKYLDLSATCSNGKLQPAFNDLFSTWNISLTELNFSHNNFKLSSQYPLFFSQLTSLETLDISNNLIRELSHEMFSPTLKTLNISLNLITTWYFSMLKNESQLQFLDVSNNQITYVSDAMIEDFYKLDSLSLNSNPLICHNKVVALVCSNIKNDVDNKTQTETNCNQTIQNNKIMGNNSRCLTLVSWQQYRCYDLILNGFRQFSGEKDCNEYYEEVSTTYKPEAPTTQDDPTTTSTGSQPSAPKLAWKWTWTFLIIFPLLLLVGTLGSIVYHKWWSIRCFFHRYFSLKKARILRKNGNLLAKPDVYYDVFVSYSDVDRAWVLDHLVPNMERYGDVSLCFHERDFQVGMSILENIIDCMDRSHALLLVVSSAFIFSKWCQFEMHLAQYRLIETFREQLVLVLLEDIPRKMRPQTLHHLMTTKTYLMWPQQPCKDDAYELFWRRLKRAIRPNSNYMLTV